MGCVKCSSEIAKKTYTKAFDNSNINNMTQSVHHGIVIEKIDYT
jgi:hypothetical protein